MEDKTVYIAIMTHGSSEFNVKWEHNKDKHGHHTVSRSYQPSEVSMPDGVEYVQYISHAPLGTCNFGDAKTKKKSLENLKTHISELKLLDGQQLSEKLIELDSQISPSIQDIDENIKGWKERLDSIHFIKWLDSTVNYFNKEKRENNIRRFNKRIEEIESTIRELQATKYISKKQGIYSYIEYDKTSPNADNMILSKFFQRDNTNERDIYVIASEGGKLKPSFEEGIFNKVSQSRRSQVTTLSKILEYLNKRGYTRIIIIDYSCNKGNYKDQTVPRNVIIDTRRHRYTSIDRTRRRSRSRSRTRSRSRSRSRSRDKTGTTRGRSRTVSRMSRSRMSRSRISE
jgi:hypothetical protein